MGSPKNGRVTIECECGVRLDVVSYDPHFSRLTSGHLPCITRATQAAGGVVDYHSMLIMRHEGRHLDPDARGFQLTDDETSVSYKCRGCGRNWAVKNQRFREAVARRHNSGGTRLVAGADF